MKEGNNWLYALLFLAGCFFCFVATQFVYLDIDYKVNVLESLIDIATVIVGLYLGITINSKFSNKQHFISFIEPKLEKILVLENDIRNIIETNNSIDNATISAKIKSLNSDVAQLSKIFKSFKKNEGCINSIDDAIDDFETKLAASPISQNVIDYSLAKNDIIVLIDKLDLKIVEAINILHNK